MGVAKPSHALQWWLGTLWEPTLPDTCWYSVPSAYLSCAGWLANPGIYAEVGWEASCLDPEAQILCYDEQLHRLVMLLAVITLHRKSPGYFCCSVDVSIFTRGWEEQCYRRNSGSEMAHSARCPNPRTFTSNFLEHSPWSPSDGQVGPLSQSPFKDTFSLPNQAYKYSPCPLQHILNEACSTQSKKKARKASAVKSAVYPRCFLLCPHYLMFTVFISLTNL